MFTCVWGGCISIRPGLDDLPITDTTAFILIIGIKEQEQRKGPWTLLLAGRIRLDPAERVEHLPSVFLFRR